ncbi:hypothetical protein [Methylobacterium sp. J-076]|uniref:hypothetical protein n=1 Tax=Methylobacterium sp. J-076 TaxID=2836655 RepID=UPI001FBA626A|nr:hypothetical protein [Methylobacterium sp. J-076]MCJ2011548.1 hypothetical protein [Methylobacterium sp. J-076]
MSMLLVPVAVFLWVVRLVANIATGWIVVFQIAVAVQSVEQSNVRLDPLGDPAAQVAEAITIQIWIVLPHSADGLRDGAGLLAEPLA